MSQQLSTAIRLGLSTLPSRRGASLVVVISMACAVGALLSISSMSAGLRYYIAQTGRDDRAIVVSRGAINEGVSSLPRGNIATIGDAPGVKHDAGGKPILSADTMVQVTLTKKSDGLELPILVRGMSSNALALRPEIHLLSGRMFQPGRHEVMAGHAAQSQFRGLDQNSKITLPDGDWTVVGSFDSGGSALQSQLLTDADTLLASQRIGYFKSVTVLLDKAADFDAFKKYLTANPTLTVDVERESIFNRRQAQDLFNLLNMIAGVVGGIMGLGALFGALNTMYSAVSARAVEIATLRAIGFGGGAVMASVLVEALLLAAAGSLIGAAVAWAAFNGNLHAFGGNVIKLAVTPGLVTNGVCFACFLGFVGGFFPALRAARRPIIDALRAT